jgi:hypothetical protein
LVSDLYHENFITAYFLAGIITIFTLGSLGVGSVSRVYQRGIPKEIVCVSHSFVAITGAVIAIFSEFTTTGAVIEILSLFLFPPKIYHATIPNPLFIHHLTVVCATICSGYSLISYPFIFSITV